MSLLQDTRFALRTLSRAPGFTVAAMLSLTISIGVNTAVFTIANALLFRMWIPDDVNNRSGVM